MCHKQGRLDLKMKLVSTRTGLTEALLVLLLLFNLSTALEGGSCYYEYVKQPSSETECNPWPLLLSNDTALSLHCHVRGPQDDHVSNIKWYRDFQEEPMIISPDKLDPKYSIPVVSGDVGNLKFENFTLTIHNVSTSDVGCYHCEIYIKAGTDCEFDIQPSSHFCLLKEENYTSDTTTCVAIPVNDSVVCAANMMCGPHPSFSIPTTVTVAPSSSLSSMNEEKSRAESTALISEKTKANTSQSFNPPSTVNHSPQSSSVDSSATFSLDSAVSFSINSHALKIQSLPVVNSPRATGSPSSQQQLRIGLYVGVGVCCLLLVVILILLAAVAVLCKAPAVKRHQRDSVAASGTTLLHPLNSTVWTRPSPTVSTSLINEESLHLHTGTQPPPTQSTSVGGSEWDVLAPGQCDSLPGTTPQVDEHERDEGAHIHHRLSLTNKLEGSNGTVHVTTPSCPGSSDTHYYHVLEQPRYYNFNWLASNPEGREILLQNWKEADSQTTTGPGQSSHRHAEVKGDGPQAKGTEAEDEGYHQRVSPLMTKRGRRSESPRRQKREAYTRLDCSKLEPRREYTRVSVKRSTNIESLEQEN